MELIWHGIVEAFRLLFSADPEVVEITLTTLKVSGTAALISVLIGVPLGTVLALVSFPGRKLVMSVVNTTMGIPPVVVGLWVSISLWRSGPFGSWDLIYTSTAMIIAQAIIASPIVLGLTAGAIQQTSPKLRLQIRALGATNLQYLWLLLGEVRYSLLAAIIAGFGRVVAEIGASMMVGGNIKGETRVLTTATALEVSKGNFDLAIALSLILSLLAWGVTLGLTQFQQKQRGG